MAITNEDQAILDWLPLVPASTYETLHAATGRSIAALRHRLPDLRRAGLVRRDLVRQGHKFTAVWSTGGPNDAAQRRQRAPLTTSQEIGPDRTTVITAALLPHFTQREPSTRFLIGTAVASGIDDLILKVRLRETANSPDLDTAKVPSPDILIIGAQRVSAIEIWLTPEACDWQERLRTYSQLRVENLEVHTTATLLAPMLRHASQGLPGPQIQVTYYPPQTTTVP